LFASHRIARTSNINDQLSRSSKATRLSAHRAMTSQQILGATKAGYHHRPNTSRNFDDDDRLQWFAVCSASDVWISRDKSFEGTSSKHKNNTNVHDQKGTSFAREFYDMCLTYVYLRIPNIKCENQRKLPF
jgi:hypothetical protein